MTIAGCPSPRKEIKSLNVMKGLLMFGVVGAHVLFVNENMTAKTELVPGILYMGLMSFFIIGGYFYNPDRCYLDCIKKRFKQLVIPITLCTAMLPLILYIYLYLIGQPQLFSDYTDNIINFLLGSSRFGLNVGDLPHENIPIMVSLGYYFLMTMFVSFLVFYAIAKKAMNNEKTLIISIATLLVIQFIIVETLHVYLPYYIQLAPITIAFMLVGSWVAKKGIIVKLEDQGWRNSKLFIIAIVALIIDIALVWFNPTSTFVNLNFGTHGSLSVFPFFVEGVLSFIWFFYLCLLISSFKPASIPFSIIGHHTLAILLFHEFFIKIIIAPFYVLPSYPLPYTFPVIQIGEGLVITILSIVIIIALAKLYEKLKERVKEKRKGYGDASNVA